MATQISSLAEIQHMLVSAGEEQKTRAISAVNAALRCRICLSVPKADLAYAQCCETIIGCLSCIEDNENMGNTNCPNCGQARFGRNLHRVAGWYDALGALAEDDDVPILERLF